MAGVTDEYGNPVGLDLWPWSRNPRSPNRPPFKPQPPVAVMPPIDPLTQGPSLRALQPGDDVGQLLRKNPRAWRYYQDYRARQEGFVPPVKMPIAPPRGPIRRTPPVRGEYMNPYMNSGGGAA